MLSGWLAASPLYSPASSSYTYAGICIRRPTHGGAIECFVNGPELLSKVDGAVKSCWPMACLYRPLRFGEEYLPVSALLVDKT